MASEGWTDHGDEDRLNVNTRWFTMGFPSKSSGPEFLHGLLTCIYEHVDVSAGKPNASTCTKGNIARFRCMGHRVAVGDTTAEEGSRLWRRGSGKPPAVETPHAYVKEVLLEHALLKGLRQRIVPALGRIGKRCEGHDA